jgi:hypothetical protein
VKEHTEGNPENMLEEVGSPKEWTTQELHPLQEIEVGNPCQEKES